MSAQRPHEPCVQDACPTCHRLHAWDREAGDYPTAESVTITWTYGGSVFTTTAWLCPCNGIAVVAVEIGTAEPELKQRLYTCTLESLYAQASSGEK